MRTEVLVACLVALPLCLAGPAIRFNRWFRPLCRPGSRRCSWNGSTPAWNGRKPAWNERNPAREESRFCTSQSCRRNCKDGIRIRKNVNSLSRQERRRLVSALQASIQRGEYQKVGNYHGAPYSLCGGEPCCPHGTSGFLPWHRLFMVHMEEELGDALPYWDWTEEGEVPSLWESIKAPIQHPAVGQCSSDGFTSRDPRPQVNTEELKARVEVALMEETFEDFWEELIIPHNQLHSGMGCDMRAINTAAYDPVFYLHHTYIDYVFAFWQELQRLRGHNKVPAIQDLADALPPFNNRRYNNKSITFQNNRGRDTFEYTAKYCYKYQDLKFDGLTPAQFLKLHSTVPMHIFIGIVVPKVMPNGYITFDLCLAGRCVQAGKVASFGIAVTTIINVDR